jgi:CRISPR-associated protein (TIGR02584 family)
MKKRAASKSSRPVSSQETVLLAVTGMSPAILTETVWALAHEKPPVVPDRVVVVTTLAGRAGIARDLLEPRAAFGGACLWDDLMAALEKEKIGTRHKLRFGATGSDIRVFTARDPVTGRSRELEDIRTREENEAAADFLLETLRSFTENEDCSVVASIAGGRKTMGALLYACTSLLGRDGDRLTHVLVNEPFDDPRLTPRFYFPAQRDAKLKTPDGRIAHAGKARISLADVPFVTLRNLFQKELRRLPGGFGALVQRCRAEVAELAGDNLRLSILRSRPRAEVDGRGIVPTPREHLLLLFLAARAGRTLGEVYADIEDDLNALREETRQSAPGDSFGDWRGHDSLGEPIRESDDTIRKLISGLRAKFKTAGPAGARIARALPERGRISLDLPPEAIRILA